MFIMDAKNVQDDLNALQTLYGLLKNDADDSSKAYGLDYNALRMLKNMLDAETKRTLKALLEIISGQVQASDSLSISDNNHIQQSQALLSEERPIQPTLSATSESTQSCLKDTLDSGKGKLDEGLDAMKEKNPSRQETIENECMQKRCRLCRRNTIKKIESSDVALQIQQSNQSDRLGCGVRSDNGSLSSDNVVVTSIGNKVADSYSEANNKSELEGLSAEVSKAIRHIELCLSVLQIADENLHKNSAQRRAETGSSVPVVKTQLIEEQKQANISQHEDEHEVKTINKLVSENESRRSQERVDYPEKRVPSATSPKWKPDTSSTSRLAAVESIKECSYPIEILDNVKSVTDGTVMRPNQIKVAYNIPPSQASTVYSRLTVNEENGKGNLFNSDEAFLNNNDKRRSNSQLVDSHEKDTKPSPFNTIRSLQAKHSYHHPQHKEIFSKKRASPGEQESHSSASSSSPYASNSDDGEDRSSSEEPRNEQYMTPTSSESPLSPDSLSQYSSYSGDSEDETYSSEANQEATGSTSSSNGEEEYSSYDHQSIHSPVKAKYYLNQPTSKKKPGLSRIHRSSAYGVSSKTKPGTWKRLKDRLAIIFHHHHHHHHHHHKDDNHVTKMGRSTSKRQDEASAEKAIEAKTGKSRLREKDQRGHFNGLVGGFLRHAWHTNKSRQKKRTIGELAQGQRRGNKKTLKKSKWWTLVRHRRRAKLTSKSRSKLALGKKKITIKALPG